MKKKIKDLTLEEIKPNRLVLFKKHNGRNRPITYRAIFIDDIVDNCLFYDTYDGTESITFKEIKRDKAEIIKIIDLESEVEVDE